MWSRRWRLEGHELSHNRSRRHASRYRPHTLARVHGRVSYVTPSRTIRRRHLVVAGSIGFIEGDSQYPMRRVRPALIEMAREHGIPRPLSGDEGANVVRVGSRLLAGYETGADTHRVSAQRE